MSLDDQSTAPLPRLPARQAASHKGDYGRALLVGGSRGMSGAIALAGRAALRSGAGLVTLAVPCGVQEVAAAFEPSYMTHGLADEDGRFAAAATDEVLALAAGATAVALGPGLGRSPAVTEFVIRLYREIAQPMVVDADALFAFSDRRDSLGHAGGPRVLTPHPGEFARLTGQPIHEDDETRVIEAAALAGVVAEAAGQHDVVVVLKGHHTVVADGSRVSVNPTGNPGMATGGTGDVLTGVITGLLCQGLAPWEAARLGVYVHGLAGDLAARDLGQTSMIATDVIDYLPSAYLSVEVQS